MIWIAYIVTIVFFIFLFEKLRVILTCRKILLIGLAGIEIFANHLLPDKNKERLIKKKALKMLKNIPELFLRILSLLFLSIFPVWFFEKIGWISWSRFIDFSLDWRILLVTLIGSILIYLFYSKEAPGSDQSEDDYLIIDRIVHNLAFGSKNLLGMLVYLEKKFFSRKYEKLKIEKPIFITSLPRAGTTILLESLASCPDLATHTYRNMPFVFTPVIWDRFSNFFKVKKQKKVRAHGDGLKISPDSPEAFEEALWSKFFPQKYSNKKISLWHSADQGFSKFFDSHLKKIVYLKKSSQVKAKSIRYLSKNNANIARVTVLKQMHPDCFIIVPVRDPVNHAISMLRQHQNFLCQHREDHFAKKYMADIGHFEFGELHRPISFPEWDKLKKDLTPDRLDYWLVYWLSAFKFLKNQEGLIFVSYEKLCKQPEQELKKIAQKLELDLSQSQIKKMAKFFHAPPRDRSHAYDFDKKAEKRAKLFYLEMC